MTNQATLTPQSPVRIETGSIPTGRYPECNRVIGGTIANFQTPNREPVTSPASKDPFEAPRAIIRNQAPSSINIEDLFALAPNELLKK